MRKGIVLLILLILSVTAFCMGIDMRFPVKYSELVYKYAGDLEPSLIYSVIKTESGFRPQVRSHKGASGLMQLTEETARWMAGHMGLQDFEPENIFDPEVNIAIGCFFLNWLTDYYDGDLILALCAYNAGLGNVNRWLSDTRYSRDGKTLSAIPFPETDQYIQRVEFSQGIYDLLLRYQHFKNKMLG